MVRKAIDKIIILNALMTLFVLSTCSSAVAGQSIEKNVVIQDVVSGAEDAYVKTDIGDYFLPSPSAEIDMDTDDVGRLISVMKSNTGKHTVLVLVENTVVGFKDGERTKFIPAYR